MEALAEAALQSETKSGNPEQPESTKTPSNVAQDASSKRGRGTALEAAKNKLAEKRMKISESESKVMKLESMAGLKAKEKAALEKEKDKSARFRGELVKLERNLEEK